MRKVLLSSAALAMLAASAASAAAQDGERAQLEEVVVTAQKRVGTVQKTPLAVTALGGETLEKQNVADAGDLTGRAPNLTVGQAGNEVIISIRGVSSSGVVPQRDPSVAFHIDGVYLPRPSGANSVFYDLERVEVLRGPQGTLWGRNATAGSLNIITRKPVQDVEGAAEILYGSYNRLKTQGMLNLPITETLAARASFVTNRYGGYQKSAINGQPDLNDADEQAARLHLLFKPNDKLKVLVSTDYYHAGGAGAGNVLIGNGATNYLKAGQANPYVATTNTAGRRDNRITGIQSEITYAFEPFDLISLTALRHDNQETMTDTDATATGTDSQHYINKNKTFSQELRIASHGDGRLKYILGAFYIKETNDDNLYVYTNLAQTTGQILQRPHRFAKSWAGFGQLDFDVTDNVTVFGGLRYSEDEKGNPDGLTRVIGTISNSFRPDAGKWDKWTWRLGGNWEVTSNNMIYATVATGYKAGGFSSNRNFGPETLTSYEIGSKNYFLDRRVLANFSAFQYDYKDLQVVSVVPDENGISRALTTNAGVSTVKGLEFEGQAKVSSVLSFDVTLSYLDAKFDVYKNAVDSLYANVLDLSGNRLPRAPKWGGNFGVTYSTPVATGGVTLRASTRYQSKVYYTEFNDRPIVTAGTTIHPYATASQDAHWISDISARYDDERGWYVEAYVDNVGDKAVLLATSVNTARSFFGNFGAPRTAGVKLGMKFH